MRISSRCLAAWQTSITSLFIVLSSLCISHDARGMLKHCLRSECLPFATGIHAARVHQPAELACNGRLLPSPMQHRRHLQRHESLACLKRVLIVAITWSRSALTGFSRVSPVMASERLLNVMLHQAVAPAAFQVSCMDITCAHRKRCDNRASGRPACGPYSTMRDWHGDCQLQRTWHGCQKKLRSSTALVYHHVHGL